MNGRYPSPKDIYHFVDVKITTIHKGTMNMKICAFDESGADWNPDDVHIPLTRERTALLNDVQIVFKEKFIKVCAPLIKDGRVTPERVENFYLALFGEIWPWLLKKALKYLNRKKILDSLPQTTVNFSLEPHWKDHRCSICITDAQDRDRMRTLPCSHHYHEECINMWLLKNSTCPLCKAKLQLLD